MTLVMIWPNKTEQPTAIHIAADSLLSDGNNNQWVFAPKIFRAYPTPEDQLKWPWSISLRRVPALSGVRAARRSAFSIDGVTPRAGVSQDRATAHVAPEST